MKDFFYKINCIFSKKEKTQLLSYLVLSLFTPVIEAVGVGSIAALIMLFFDKLSNRSNDYS